MIDQYAVHIPRQSGLLPCLYVPVAARDIDAIKTYVGSVIHPLASLNKAVLVEPYEPARRDERLPIWNVPEAVALHQVRQVWVHIEYTAYRRAYIRAFPNADLGDRVIEHVIDRRIGRLKGFTYLRIVPIFRATNSSRTLASAWSLEHHSSPEMMAKNRESLASVQYADLFDIVKMLNLQGGGSLMSNVNNAQKLVDIPA